jgi:CheY-like chemotaxis protein
MLLLGRVWIGPGHPNRSRSLIIRRRDTLHGRANSLSMRGLIRRVLDSFGMRTQCRECADGREAVDEYRRFRPDIVFMDIRMQNLDGLSATRLITAEHPGAYVVILTELDEDELREEAREAGASRYLLKDDLSRIVPLLKKRGAR